MGVWRLSPLLACALLAAATASQADTFPRLMGMNIGAKNYEDPRYQQELARLDVAILGFYRGWRPPGYAPDATAAMRKALQAIKARNPRILLGQYTVLNEAYDDPRDAASADLRDKLYASQWWLPDAAGRKVQWTSQFSAWEVNFTSWAKLDAGGRRWPQWLAERNHAVFFRDVPEFDIVYFDNVMSPPRVTADWDADRANDDPKTAKVLAAHYAGHRAHWQRVRELQPKALLVGNTDNDLGNAEWRDQLDGAFLEGLMGERWSIETWAGWDAMMQRYRAVLRHTRPPKIVGFNVHGSPSDKRLFRYAYASCLLEDGYFSFTDKARGHSSVPWFDEYDIKLGRALQEPPAAAWSQGVWRRDFENGTVLVNPTGQSKTVAVASGRVTLGPKDGIVLRK